MSLEILISQEAGAWPDCSKDAIESALTACFDCFREKLQSFHEVSILLTNTDHIRKLNCHYRGKDAPTNVLSFPQFDDIEDLPFLPEDLPRSLGDIILAYEIIEREANEKGITLFDHISHLSIHGALHLLGFDHIEDAQADDMESIEVKLLNKLGISNPYKETMLP